MTTLVVIVWVHTFSSVMKLRLDHVVVVAFMMEGEYHQNIFKLFWIKLLCYFLGTIRLVFKFFISKYDTCNTWGEIAGHTLGNLHLFKR